MSERAKQEVSRKGAKNEKSEKWQVKSAKAKRAVAYPFRGRVLK